MSYQEMGVKVGIEVHQQLNVGRKLFCNCPMIETDEVDSRILRRLRPTQSELGEVDPAVLYEFRKGKATIYLYNRKNACLVECDEEPPHPINMEAVKAAMTIAMALNSKIVEEMHVMRKIVIDGSNTTGFQRTVLVGLGGYLEVGNLVVPVQTVSLEEDAARIIEEGEDFRVYSLDRLGIPLVEVALAPISADPKTVERVALELGRLLRLTKLVARGLGTIRQDLNISVHGFSPSEVKGVQKLDLIPKIVEYEVRRQDYLYRVSKMLKDRGVDAEKAIGRYVDVSEAFQITGSKIVREALSSGKRAWGLKLAGFRGLLGAEPYPDVRLGLELAEMARAYHLGGVIHSDELPAYGISQGEVEEVERTLDVAEGDGFFLIFALKEDEEALSAVRRRAIQFFEGPVPETRGPLSEGRTKYSRPRPGAARMYPETDIPLIRVTDELLAESRKHVPRPWKDTMKDYMSRYGLNEKLAGQILDSNYLPLFENVCSNTRLPPTFVAVSLTESLVSLSREGLDTSFLTDMRLSDIFSLVDSGAASKESVLDIMRLMCQNRVEAEVAANRLGIRALSEDQLRNIVSTVVTSNMRLIEAQGDRSFGALMGEVMRQVRGKVDGGRVSEVLKEEIRKALAGKR